MCKCLQMCENAAHAGGHGRDVRHVIAQERAPALTRQVASLRHVLGRLSHRNAELEQFPMNVRCTPKPIVNAHPQDQRLQFRRDLRARKTSGWAKSVAGFRPRVHWLRQQDYARPSWRRPAIGWRRFWWRFSKGAEGARRDAKLAERRLASIRSQRKQTP